MDDDFADDLFRRIRSDYGTMGVCIYRVGSRGFQNRWGSGWSLSICRFHGDLPHIVRKNKREAEPVQDYAAERLSVRGMLSDGLSFPFADSWTDWMCSLRVRRGHYVAWHNQPFFPKVSTRRHRYVCFFGVSRGFRRYSKPGNGRKFLRNGWRQSENRAAGRRNLPHPSSSLFACFKPKAKTSGKQTLPHRRLKPHCFLSAAQLSVISLQIYRRNRTSANRYSTALKSTAVVLG